MHSKYGSLFRLKNLAGLFCILNLFSMSVSGQENYEIQVYPSYTAVHGVTLLELHSNYTPIGQPATDIRPTQEAFHETIEVTHGFLPWFETGFYLFTNYHPDYGWNVVGVHVRPRIGIPESMDWPVGLSLSTEFGYQRSEYSKDTWSIEIRPIIDKNFKWAYFSFNPTFGVGLKGRNQGQPAEFEPSLKAAFHVFKKADFGFEYYGSTGPISGFDPIQEQGHALYIVTDLFFSPLWEFNMGAGWGLTEATDGMVIKLIVGRRFGKSL